MPFLSSGAGDNAALKYAVAIVLILVAVVLLIAIFRTVFNPRIRLSGARGRQSRLGVVDIYHLDRERHLVIVRRDNVEHLLMIGGPNDVVIEPSIVRVEARLREPTPNWTEAGESDARPSAPEPAPPPPPPAATVRELPRLPDLFARPRKTQAPAPQQPAAPQSAPHSPEAPAPEAAPAQESAPPAAGPSPQEPPIKKPLPPFFQRREKPVQPAPEPVVDEALFHAPPEPPPPVHQPVAPPQQPAAPPPRPAIHRPPPVRPAPHPVAPPPVVSTPKPPVVEAAVVDPLESLEEEMAKLLGRPTKSDHEAKSP